MCAVSVGTEKVPMRARPRQHEHQRVFVLHVFQQPVLLNVTFAKAFFISVMGTSKNPLPKVIKQTNRIEQAEQT